MVEKFSRILQIGNMLFKRLIPKIVVMNHDKTSNSDFTAILTRSFKPYREIGSPLSQIRIHQSNLVDEILLVHRNRRPFDLSFCDLVEQSCETLNTPLTVGGAIEKLSHVRAVFNSGADKIVIGRARGDLKLLESIASSYGKQSLVISVDYSEEDLKMGLQKFVKQEILKGYSVFSGELSLTNISRDGAGSGVDLRLVNLFREYVEVPIVVGGGAGNVSDLFSCFNENCDAVTISTFLSQTDQSVRQIRSHLSSMGVHIRTRN